MNLPITPITVNAALQLAQRTTEALASTLKQGASFAELLAPSSPNATTGDDAAKTASAKLQALHDQLKQRLSDAGVDLGFRVDLVVKGDAVSLENVHPDEEQIQSALANDKQLTTLFKEVQQLLSQLNPHAASQGAFRLQLKDNEVTFDFGGW